MSLLMLAAAITGLYLSLNRAFNTQIDSVSIGTTTQQSTDPTIPDTVTSEDERSQVCDSGSCLQEDNTENTSGGAIKSEVVSETTLTLKDTIVQWMAISSIITFTVFALLTVLVIWRTTGTMLTRLDSISRQTAALNPEQLSQRISITGPNDEIQHLADTLNTMLERNEQILESQRSFVRNASHELRTPITTITTSLEMLVSQNRINADATPMVQRAITASHTSAGLITALLELSRIQADAGGTSDTDNTSERASHIDLEQALRTALSRHTDQAEASHLTIETSALQPAVVTADSRYLDLIIDNLLTNAIIHNTEHGTIHITATTDADGAHLTITNTTAASTTQANPSDLIEPFQRGDLTRLANKPGYGLGLSITQAATNAIGATLKLEYPAANQLRATIIFPIRTPDRA